MKKLFCAIAALGLLSACAEEAEEAEVTEEEALADAQVNETAMEPATTLATWDANADGQFQQTEYTANANNFGTWDADSNASLSQEEFNAGWTQAGWEDGEGAFTAFDDNSDGMLANDEFFSEDEWGEWDANSDGVLDTNEWTF